MRTAPPDNSSKERSAQDRSGILRNTGPDECLGAWLELFPPRAEASGDLEGDALT